MMDDDGTSIKAGDPINASQKNHAWTEDARPL